MATASKTLDTAGFLNRIEFTNPQIVSAGYAVGLEFSGFSGDDELGIVTNADGDANNADLAWEQWSGGDWYSMNEAWNSQTDGNFDLGIFPILCPQNVTGVNEESLSFSVYPNPTNGEFALVNTNGLEAEVSVLNPLGQVVFRSSILGQDILRVDLSGQNPGVYFIKVDSDQGSWTERIVLR